MIGNHIGHLSDILNEVLEEVRRASAKHPRPQSSPHEGYGVLAEEVHEFFLEMIANNHTKGRVELIQVAAMAVRTVIEVYDKVHQQELPDAAMGYDRLHDVTSGVSPGRLTKDSVQRSRDGRCSQCGGTHDHHHPTSGA